MSLPKECPVGPRRKRAPKKNLEAAVLRECLGYLRDNDDVVYVERRNTGAVQFQDGGFIRFGAKGAGDIWALVRAQVGAGGGHYGEDILVHVELEIKRSDGKGRLSSAQKSFQQFCAEKDIPYYVITSIEELKAAIEEVQCG